MVFQESFLFSNTVAANIAFGHPEATQAQIERAARIAAAHDFILDLPKGYEPCSARAATASPAASASAWRIARAVLLEPAILLLDDPTAAIDCETEHEIFEALDRAIAGRTTFIVAHRLSTLRRADFIIVMDDGRIVQRGTHEELMQRARPLPARGQPAARRQPRAAGAAANGGAAMSRTPHAELNLLPGPPAGDDDEDEEQFKPLEWGLIRRLLGYTRPHRRKFWVMIGAVHGAGGPAAGARLGHGRDHRGPDRARHDLRGIAWALLGYAAAGGRDGLHVPLPPALRPRDRRNRGQRACGRTSSRTCSACR